MTVTEAEVRALVVSATRKHGEDVSTLGVHATDAAIDDVDLEIDGRPWQVRRFESAYLLRRALSRLGKNERMVAVTSLDEGVLGIDVLSRFPSPRLERVEPWRMVREYFEAETLDPRLSSLAWLPRVVQAMAGRGGIHPSPDRHLSLEHVWQELLAMLGVPRRPLSVRLLLEVPVSTASNLLEAVPEDCRRPWLDAMEQRVGAVVGPAGVGIVRAWASPSAASPVVLGIALDALLRSNDTDRVNAGWVRLADRSAVGEDRSAPAYGPWAEAAVGCARDLLLSDPRGFDELVQASGRFLIDVLKVSPCAAASRVLPEGLDAARSTLAQAIESFLQAPTDPAGLVRLAEAGSEVESHVQGSGSAETIRLIRRVAAGLAVVASDGLHLDELGTQYRDDLAWLESASDQLEGGHGQEALGRAVEALRGSVRGRLHAFSATFGEAVAREFASGRGPFLPLEDVLATVVDPLVKDTGGRSDAGKVLMIVMDGMSWPVARRVFAEIDRRSTLRRLTLEPQGRWRPVVSPLPSVTKVARASLIAGRLQQGGQQEERDGLRAAVARFGWFNQSGQDQVLHKASLDANARTVIGLQSSVVVAVVNAVDDQLKTGGQLRPGWSLDELPVLKDLLDAAEFERRAVVLVADHGHIGSAAGEPKRGSESGGERWRTDADPVAEGEILVQGDRVMLPVPGGPIVVPVDDRVRYAARAAGHHGGASPQEMICPLAVFVPSTIEIAERWIQESTRPPDWWTLDQVPAGSLLSDQAVAEDSRLAASTRIADSGPRPSEAREPAAASIPVVSSVPTGGWIGALLATDLFESQRTGAGRRAPEREKVERMLVLLDAAGGAMGMDELASRMQMVRTRLQGLVTSVARILNLDGFQVLSITDAGQQVRLDRGLACRQFEVEKPS